MFNTRANDEIGRLKGNVEMLMNRLNDLTSRFNGVQPTEPKLMRVEIQEEIDPLERGRGRELKFVGDPPEWVLASQRPMVTNHLEVPLREGQRYFVQKDSFGRWMPVPYRRYTSLAETPAGGIPATINGQKYFPGKADCRMLSFNTLTGGMENYIPQAPPVYETVYNMTGSAVEGDVVIQVKWIDGAWFVDVEPCVAP